MAPPSDLIEYSKIIEVCEDLIEYYQHQEDYEKCAEIKKAMKVYVFLRFYQVFDGLNTKNLIKP